MDWSDVVTVNGIKTKPTYRVPFTCPRSRYAMVLPDAYRGQPKRHLQSKTARYGALLAQVDLLHMERVWDEVSIT
jgi:hypothetical protein